jgi:anti-anti-sigma factor
VDQLRVSVSGGDAYTVVALAGESDVYTYDQLRGALEAEATKGVPLLIVDLSALEFMDSTGVQVLLDIRVMMNDRGGKLALAGPQNTVARVLNLVGADQLIPVYPSVEEAVGTPLTLRRNTAHAAPEHRSRSAGTPPVTQPAPHRAAVKGRRSLRYRPAARPSLMSLTNDCHSAGANTSFGPSALSLLSRTATR